jgi:hypothetical protein
MMTSTTFYAVAWHDGRRERYATYEDACWAILAKHPDAVLGRPGDINDGGLFTPCWHSELTANGLDERRTIAVIHEASDP